MSSDKHLPLLKSLISKFNSNKDEQKKKEKVIFYLRQMKMSRKFVLRLGVNLNFSVRCFIQVVKISKLSYLTQFNHKEYCDFHI